MGGIDGGYQLNLSDRFTVTAARASPEGDLILDMDENYALMCFNCAGRRLVWYIVTACHGSASLNDQEFWYESPEEVEAEKPRIAEAVRRMRERASLKGR